MQSCRIAAWRAWWALPCLLAAGCGDASSESRAPLGEAQSPLCAWHWQCPPDMHCGDGICVAGPAGPTSCTTGDGCSTGHCVDGFCCDSACAGQCEACDIAGALGVCTPVSGTPRGARAACATDGTQCGGTCDGVGRSSCSYPSTSVACAGPSCTDGVAKLGAFCDSQGACGAAETQPCGAFLCGSTVCLGDCGTHAECGQNSYCNAGICQAKKENGAACTSAAQCGSGMCVDGVCCSSDCDGQCAACNLPGSEGTCSPVLGSPKGGRPHCASDGSACGGACDGVHMSACTYPGAAVSCREESCADAIAVLGSTCDGAGSCPSAQFIACGAEGCAGKVCDGPCVADSDCGADEFCAASMCVPLIDLGEVCASDAQCASAHCKDGVCCDTSCGSQCAACNVPGSEGTCTPVSGAPVGARPACATDGSLCGGTCDGVHPEGCAFAASTVSCGSASCEDGVARAEAFCDAMGSCPEALEQACGAFLCGEAACEGDCATAADCTPGSLCVAGMCMTPLPQGAPCGAGEVCGSGFCADGFCCDQACDEQCEACGELGSEGVCVAVAGSPRPGRDACRGEGACAGACDGARRDACGFPDAGVVCEPGSCEGGVETPPSTCDGEGECQASPTVTAPCGAAAPVGCASDVECGDGATCVSGACEAVAVAAAVAAAEPEVGSCASAPGTRGGNTSIMMLALAAAAGFARRRRA